jgi:hypothetical protein
MEKFSTTIHAKRQAYFINSGNYVTGNLIVHPDYTFGLKEF